MNKARHTITIDCDRSTSAGMAAALLISVVVAIFDTRLLFLGKVMRVSVSTIFVALACLVGAFLFRNLLVKLALVLIGVEALLRIILSHVRASYALRHAVAAVGMALKIVGLLMVIFTIVKWFQSVLRRVPISEPGEPTS